MERVVLRGMGGFDEWRDAARRLLAADIPPAAVEWRQQGEADLFAAAGAEILPDAAGSISVPRAFVALAETVVCHSAPARFALLYRLLHRLQSARHLLSDATDADVAAARMLEKSVRRDAHKMTAFVRFREVEGPRAARRRFVAWFEPDHYVVARTAPFFARRFADMDWMILTPKGAAAFEEGVLTLSDHPAEKPALADPTDALWLTYYASIFNPARLKTKAMQAEMPKKYWRNLPEAALIPTLVESAAARVAAMAARGPTPPPAFHQRLQARKAEAASETPSASAETLASLRDAARHCTRCPLHCHATQTVFGEGPESAALMLVGEQPGDREDLAGRPFVGPAGQVLDQALRTAGIERQASYLTNAVKHFKHEPRGKRRLHRRPNASEVTHCRWWLQREIELVRPRLIVALGATALLALTGQAGDVHRRRGQVVPLDGRTHLIRTIHPSYLLRLSGDVSLETEKEEFGRDLRRARDWLAGRAAA